MITKDEFDEWKQMEVTKEFFAAVQERIEDAKDILSLSAGKEPDEDSFFRGFIFAYREACEFRVDSED